MIKKIKGLFYFEQSQKKLAAVLVIPTVLLVFMVLLFPLLYSLFTSFGDFRIGDDLRNFNFVGFGNYIEVFKDSRFIKSLYVSAQFVFASVLLKIVFGILIAVVLKEKFVGRGLVRSLIIIPWAVPQIVAGVFWRWMLNTEVGIINYILLKIGIIDKHVPFLISKTWAMRSIIIADLWQATPLFAIIMLSGLQTIPDNLYEAAKIDGAGGVGSFFRITLPLIKPQIFVSTIIGTIFAVNTFDLFIVLTAGGPASSTTNTTLFNWQVTFKFFKVSYGASISYIILIITLIITFVYIILIRRGEGE